VRSGDWKGKDLKMLIDVGTGDNFYKQGQLLPENFEKAVKEAGAEGVKVRYQQVSLRAGENEGENKREC
jgi:S-formylglutathione hydrolase